jgi:quercetin dioxygenase-like cupin family protein
MKVQPFFVAPEDYGQALNVLGGKITVLASNTETLGYEITLQQGEEGIGPPPHSHDWDESFFVLEGRVEIHCGGKSSVCGSGTLIHVPAGTVHGFHFCAGGGRMLEISGKGGRATRMFRNVSEAFPSGSADIPKLLDVLRENGVSVAA